MSKTEARHDDEPREERLVLTDARGGKLAASRWREYAGIGTTLGGVELSADQAEKLGRTLIAYAREQRKAMIEEVS